MNDDDSTAPIDELVAAYLATALRWDELQSDPKTANAAFDENHRLSKLLRATTEGREEIAKLMTHPAAGVRLLAATDSLYWASEPAVQTLETIERGPGLQAVTAEYTLRAFRDGTLNLDW